MIVSLKYWKCESGHGNFGDELSPFIVSNILNGRHELVYNTSDSSHTGLVAIGSYIHYATTNDHIWGSGVRTDPPTELDATHSYESLNVHAVRGPLTKLFLERKGITVPPVFGDPSLLLPLFYTPTKLEDLSSKIGIIPHCSKIDKYTDDDTYCVISPVDDFKDVVNKIVSCKAIVSSSLHGLIVSDAYGVPNVWINDHIDEGDFKFNDYFLSQGRDCTYIESISEYDDKKLYAKGNTIDLKKLLQAFPF